MSEAQHPLDLESPRLSVKKPEVRFDKQGERPDEERLAAAMTSFVKDFGRAAAAYMESCIHCGNCAEACHFYLQTRDPKYTPIWKIEPFKQAYQREAGPFAWLYRALNLKSAVTVAELESWQELIYDSCTMCGRCTMICPMGIDIASLVGLARHGMFQAGLVPHELWAVAERAEREGSPLGATPKVLKDRLEWLADEHEVDDAPRRAGGRRARHVLLDRDHEVSAVARRDGAGARARRLHVDDLEQRLRSDELRDALGQRRVAEAHAA